MADIVIDKLNNIYARVTCEPSIAQELSEFFTFTSPGAEFSPQYKNKYWDGKIRLFSLRTFQIYVGLATHIVEFAKMNDYSVQNNIDHVGKGIHSDFIKNLNLPAHIQVRDYQVNAFGNAVTKKRLIALSPTASGKSLIIYMIIKHLLSIGKKKGLLIVPTISLVEQMYSDFASYGWEVDKHCQKVYSGFSKEPNAFLTISTWQSIFDMPKSYFTGFDFIIGDEAHTFAAKSLTSIMTKLVNCDYRIGTTGTLSDWKVNKLVLEGLFGPVKRFISTKELMDRKLIADLQIKCIVIKYDDEQRKKASGMEYHDEIELIISNQKRNEFINKLTLSLQGNTLILFNYVEKHGKILHELICNNVEGNRKVFFVFGGTDALDREAIRAITEKESDAIIVASYGTFSTGINIRNLHNIIFASPTKSKIRTLQSIGRALRLGDNKDSATLYDIVDDLRHKTNTNFALKHFEERIRMYGEEQFKFTITNVRI